MESYPALSKSFALLGKLHAAAEGVILQRNHTHEIICRNYAETGCGWKGEGKSKIKSCIPVRTEEKTK